MVTKTVNRYMLYSIAIYSIYVAINFIQNDTHCICCGYIIYIYIYLNFGMTLSKSGHFIYSYEIRASALYTQHSFVPIQIMNALAI